MLLSRVHSGKLQCESGKPLQVCKPALLTCTKGRKVERRRVRENDVKYRDLLALRPWAVAIKAFQTLGSYTAVQRQNKNALLKNIL